jgi:hypothetical protein
MEQPDIDQAELMYDPDLYEELDTIEHQRAIDMHRMTDSEWRKMADEWGEEV